MSALFAPDSDAMQRALALLADMSFEEKLGQMNQVNGDGGHISGDLAQAIREGRVGSVINEVNPDIIVQLQRIAVHESRCGIPLLIGRDVIHGFKTIFPIPLGLASSWCPDTIESAARISALEASEIGINWTFSPMIDICRDPRWGRVAECFGEDPVLCSTLAVAMVKGYQTDDLASQGAIAACAKHFVGYGASESGRDYNTTNISEHDLRNVHMPSFHAASNNNVATFMTSFSDVNGEPVSANKWLLTDVLKDEWHFGGLVVSDWASVHQLTVHGIAGCDRHAAELAINAGVDMEMVSATFISYGHQLIHENKVQQQRIDQAVARILAVKFALGLFDQGVTNLPAPKHNLAAHLDASRVCAEKSCVLLKNQSHTLPLNTDKLNSVALLGMLADDDYEQLGTWIFDGDITRSCTLHQGLRNVLPDHVAINYHKVFDNTRDCDTKHIPDAITLASASDAVIVCVGEEAILSGEAHCRAELGLPGAQQQLINALSEHLSSKGVPLILVVMAGRPLAIESAVQQVDALLYAWHPGSMGGAAIANLLVGNAVPSGKLPITFPRKVGQIPIYHSVKPGGRPVNRDNFVHMDAFPMRAEQTSLGMSSSHMDTDFTPLFPFGFGLSYTHFAYHDVILDNLLLHTGDTLGVSLAVTNQGHVAGDEVVQLYIRDHVASATRPVRELKAFQRVSLQPGETQRVKFHLPADELAFFDARGKRCLEPGTFTLWVGGDSNAALCADFELVGEVA
ncbi:glycoside hydrolase family 3 N-terminal domain-containing protein [Aestuariibacter salexigens]|uniref:glycoside hydrolase family 3 N-terminal domain-containing protein n=1 Tax=Aestuariibacter salexigens TaxID=226010 RepID=UPI0003F4F479|nr:glycoside hydrolase family 3 N-terminal domain-containing protein [Aestuariibacter salexigens]